MKKILSVFLAIAFLGAVAYAGTTNGYAGFDNKQKPTDVYVVKLGTGFGTNDTIAASGSVRYGPYPMSIDPSRSSFQQLRFFAPIGALVSDSLQCAYQLLSGNALGDTCAASAWTATDTLQPGEIGTTVDISGKVGQAIIFRLLNTSGASAIIRKPLKVILRESVSGEVDVKR